MKYYRPRTRGQTETIFTAVLPQLSLAGCRLVRSQLSQRRADGKGLIKARRCALIVVCSSCEPVQLAVPLTDLATFHLVPFQLRSRLYKVILTPFFHARQLDMQETVPPGVVPTSFQECFT